MLYCFAFNKFKTSLRFLISPIPCTFIEAKVTVPNITCNLPLTLCLTLTLTLTLTLNVKLKTWAWSWSSFWKELWKALWTRSLTGYDRCQHSTTQGKTAGGYCIECLWTIHAFNLCENKSLQQVKVPSFIVCIVCVNRLNRPQVELVTKKLNLPNSQFQFRQSCYLISADCNWFDCRHVSKVMQYTHLFIVIYNIMVTTNTGVARILRTAM